MEPDWNSLAERGVAFALGKVPEVGGLLSALVGILWPTKKADVWSQIAQQAEALVDERIAENQYENVQNSLLGIQGNAADYLKELQDGDPARITSKWDFLNGDFLQQRPTFESQAYPGYQLVLLPLFAQFANLHLAHLRDGVLYGAQWGWTPKDVEDAKANLKGSIADYSTYGSTIYAQGYSRVFTNTPVDYHECQPFRSINAYKRGMAFAVLNYVDRWRYFDPTVYGQQIPPSELYLAREVYSDPVGTCDDSGLIRIPFAPTQTITQITVWGGDRVDAVQVTYPPNGGPGGATQTPRMGATGGSTVPPKGADLDVSSNPVTAVAVRAGDVLEGLKFTYKNGADSGPIAGMTDSPNFSFGYPNMLLSSIHVNGASRFYGSADSAVFGFKYDAKAPTV